MMNLLGIVSEVAKGKPPHHLFLVNKSLVIKDKTEGLNEAGVRRSCYKWKINISNYSFLHQQFKIIIFRQLEFR